MKTDESLLSKKNENKKREIPKELLKMKHIIATMNENIIYTSL
jgi:hypothetical protein